MFDYDFMALRREVRETYDGFAVILDKFGAEMLSEEGINTCDAYEILDDAVLAAGDMKEFIGTVANEVYKLLNEAERLLKAADLKAVTQRNEVVNILLRYIFDNCEEAVYTEYKEFCVPYPKKRGC